MNATLERIRAEARSLSPDERELLLVAIDHDLQADVPHDEDAGVENAWECEIASRIRDIKEGKVELVSTESVDAALDAVFAKHGIERQQRFTRPHWSGTHPRNKSWSIKLRSLPKLIPSLSPDLMGW